MTSSYKPTDEEKKLARKLVKHYEAHRQTFENFADNLQRQITTSVALAVHLHSIKRRTKDPKHLEEKLYRKFGESHKAKRPLDYTEENLFLKINDLAGLRILHLNTDEIPMIADGLKDLFQEESYELFEKPSARTWDDESRRVLEQMGFEIKTYKTPSFYTSIHYVIKPNKKTPYTCEIQVRTLMEEVWGEVDHRLNYPEKTSIVACKEQLAALARATASTSRLVDSIFRSHASLAKRKGRPKPGA